MSNLEATLPTRSIRRYGFKPSLPGMYEGLADTSGLSVAPEIDPRAELPAVFDQGQLGSCTANATAACFQYDGILDAADPGPLSRLWIYYFERKIEGTLGQGDTGAMGSDAFTVASTLGVPGEADWPYDIQTFEQPPPAKAIADEGHYRLAKPTRLVEQSQAAIQQVLSNRQTVAFGFTVYQSFESQAVAQAGVVPMPQAGEAVLGGHEVLCCGYLRSDPNHALVRNSWGAGWGDHGYCLFPWAYLLSPSLCTDLRTITRPAGK